jgi:hypothetical protein
LEIANNRTASSSILSGAAIRTLPVGGYTAKCMFLMSLRTTSTDKLELMTIVLASTTITDIPSVV